MDIPGHVSPGNLSRRGFSRAVLRVGVASEWVTGMSKETEGSTWWQVFPEVLPLNESEKWGYSSRGALKQRQTFSKMRDESRTVLFKLLSQAVKRLLTVQDETSKEIEKECVWKLVIAVWHS